MYSSPKQSLSLGVTMALAASLLATTVAAAGKLISDDVSIATIVLFQYSICLLLTLPWLLKQGRKVLPTTRPVLHLIRGLSGCLCFYTYYLALKFIPLVDASLLRNSAPLFVPLILLIWQGATIPRYRWLPLLIGFVGISLILRPSGEALSWWHWAGVLSGVTLAISMVSTRLLSATEPESRILLYYYVISLLCSAPLLLLEEFSFSLEQLPWLIYIGVAMYLGFLCYTKAYSYAKASVLSPITYFGVAFAGVLDWVIWGYLPDEWSLAGMTLITLGGILVMRLGERPSASSRNE